jgi:hypothetical protein
MHASMIAKGYDDKIKAYTMHEDIVKFETILFI